MLMPTGAMVISSIVISCTRHLIFFLTNSSHAFSLPGATAIICHHFEKGIQLKAKSSMKDVKQILE